MAIDDRAWNDLLETFRQELLEHCAVLSRTLLALEKEPGEADRRRHLDEAFRAAHSLKGAARAVAMEHVERLAHGVEDVLAAAREGGLELTPPLFDRLYAVVDWLVDAAGRGGKQADGASSADRASPVTAEALLRELEAARTSPTGAAPLVLSSSSGTSGPDAAPLVPRATAEVDQPRSEPTIGETVRLPAARLDAVLEQLGELIVPQLESDDALASLRTLRGEVDEWQREWRRARPSVRTLEREAGSLGPLGRFLEGNDARLLSLGDRLGELESRLTRSSAQLGRLTQDLQAEVKRLRMLPFDTVAGALERTARDVARLLDKEVRLLLIGTETELDRRLLEEIKDPLLHLVRNAIDHGIEPAATRRQLGKPVVGSIVVEVCQRAGAIVVEVEDDGAGLDPQQLRHAAAARGLVPEAELADLPDDSTWRLLFLPGFTSRPDAGPVSGRGVGLDVVARNVERLGGRVDVHSTLGRSTRFVLTLPLTLATTRALLVDVGGAPYALPASAVERVVRPERVGEVGGRAALVQDGEVLPVAALGALIGLPAGGPAARAAAAPTLVLVVSGAQRLAVLVDRVVTEQEIVVKPLGFPLLRVSGIAGATILGSGQVVPILHAADLVRAALRPSGLDMRARMLMDDAPDPAPDDNAPETPSETHRPRILVVDDSLTTRTLERYILEAAGYEVDVAADGSEALSRLHERHYDALVTDVDMPRLDGISLAERVREQPVLRDLPVILVTSLDSADDRTRGLQAGADAYIVKSAFDQDQLLRTVRELVA